MAFFEKNEVEKLKEHLVVNFYTGEEPVVSLLSTIEMGRNLPTLNTS